MRIQIRLYFTKANLLINYHRVFFPSSPFFRRIATIFKQQTHKKVLFRQLRAYLLINSFEKYQYVLLCDTNTSDFLHFPQTAFFTIQRNRLNAISIQQTQIACSFVSSLFTLPAAPRFPDCPARHGKAGTARSHLRLSLRPALCQTPAACQHSASPR